MRESFGCWRPTERRVALRVQALRDDLVNLFGLRPGGEVAERGRHLALLRLGEAAPLAKRREKPGAHLRVRLVQMRDDVGQQPIAVAARIMEAAEIALGERSDEGPQAVRIAGREIRV